MVMSDLGTMHSASYRTDPKHLAFVLTRYHTVARLLQGESMVLEVGCGDGTGAPIVRQVVDFLYGIDLIPQYLRDRQFRQWDILSGPFPPREILNSPFQSKIKTHWDIELDLDHWDAAFALDVLEHIKPESEDRFFENICSALKPYGTLIIGTPSLESQPWASAGRDEHVNCKTEDQLRETLRKHFHNVYIFGINDTTLHTGFGPMTHYRLAICVRE